MILLPSWPVFASILHENPDPCLLFLLLKSELRYFLRCLTQKHIKDKILYWILAWLSFCSSFVMFIYPMCVHLIYLLLGFLLVYFIFLLFYYTESAIRRTYTRFVMKVQTFILFISAGFIILIGWKQECYEKTWVLIITFNPAWNMREFVNVIR